MKEPLYYTKRRASSVHMQKQMASASRPGNAIMPVATARSRGTRRPSRRGGRRSSLRVEACSRRPPRCGSCGPRTNPCAPAPAFTHVTPQPPTHTSSKRCDGVEQQKNSRRAWSPWFVGQFACSADVFDSETWSHTESSANPPQTRASIAATGTRPRRARA